MSALPNLSQLEAFVSVVDTGSFVEAANELGLSGSAMSKAVSRLESEMGVKLLHRTTRSVSLTDEGRRFFEVAKKVLVDLTSLSKDMNDSTQKPSGVLSISAPVGYGRMELLSILARFSASHPSISVDLHLSDREVDLAAERIDVAIRAGSLPDNANLVARRIFTDQLTTCATPGYLREYGEPKMPTDLQEHQCLHFRNTRTGRQVSWIFIMEGEIRRLLPSGRFTIDDGQAVAQAAELGLGISQMPFFMAKDALKTGRLTEILIPYRPPATEFTALYLERRLVSPRIRALIDFLVDE